MTREARNRRAMIWALTLGTALLLAYGCAPRPNASTSLPPCPTEDSSHCYWDADTRGNGVGNDVVTP